MPSSTAAAANPTSAVRLPGTAVRLGSLRQGVQLLEPAHGAGIRAALGDAGAASVASRLQRPAHWHSFTAPNVNDLTEAARHLSVELGVSYVFDKAYCDCNWWSRLNEQGARFVTRFKCNAALTVVRLRSVPLSDGSIVLRDELVRFTYQSQGGGRRNHYQTVLRRVTVARPGKEPLVRATNDLDAPAAQIALRYKQRWLIELFFKWIKQHLNIHHFLGRSPNAVKTQILTALIAYALALAALGLRQVQRAAAPPQRLVAAGRQRAVRACRHLRPPRHRAAVTASH